MRISDWSSDVCSSDLGQVLRLVLEHADLIVDLLQRPGSGQDILAVIGRIEHGPLCVYRLARHHHAHHQGAGSAEAERGRAQIFTRKHAHYRSPWIGDWGKSADRKSTRLNSSH